MVTAWDLVQCISCYATRSFHYKRITLAWSICHDNTHKQRAIHSLANATQPLWCALSVTPLPPFNKHLLPILRLHYVALLMPHNCHGVSHLTTPLLTHAQNVALLLHHPYSNPATQCMATKSTNSPTIPRFHHSNHQNKLLYPISMLHSTPRQRSCSTIAQTFLLYASQQSNWGLPDHHTYLVSLRN